MIQTLRLVLLALPATILGAQSTPQNAKPRLLTASVHDSVGNRSNIVVGAGNARMGNLPGTPCDIQICSAIADAGQGNIIAMGTDSARNGRILHFASSATGLRLVHAQRLQGICIDGGTYHVGWSALCIADANQGVLLRADWRITDPIPDRTAFAAIARRDSIPLLVPSLRRTQSWPIVVRTHEAQSLLVTTSGLPIMEWILSEEAGAIAIRQRRTALYPQTGPWLEVDDSPSSTGPITVVASHSGRAVLQDLDNATQVDLGVLSAETRTGFTLTTPLRPGGRYRIDLVGSQAISGHEFRPQWRSGSPFSNMPFHLHSERMSVNGCKLDSAMFGATVRLTVEPHADLSTKPRLLCLFAHCAQPATAPPISSQGAYELLAAARAFEIANIDWSHISVDLDLAAPLWLNPTEFSEGDLVLCQFVLLGPQPEDLAISAITGMRIAAASGTQPLPQLIAGVQEQWRTQGVHDAGAMQSLLTDIRGRLTN